MLSSNNNNTTRLPLVLEILGVISEFLDSQCLMVVSQTCKRWRSVSLHRFPLDARSYFRKDWVEDSIELALPSNVLAISVSVDESHIYACARGYEPTDTTILYIHDTVSGQRSFEELPPAFSEELAEVWFEGPHYLVCGSRCEANAIFDCERGLELRLMSRGRNFRSSADGRHIGALFAADDDDADGGSSRSRRMRGNEVGPSAVNEEVFVVQALGPKERQQAVDATQNAWRSDSRRRDFERSISARSRVHAGSPSSPSTLMKMQMLFCPYYEVDRCRGTSDSADVPADPPQLSVPASVTCIGSTTCDCYVAKSLLVTVSRKSGDSEALVTAYFLSSTMAAAVRSGDDGLVCPDPLPSRFSARSIYVASQSTLTCTVLESMAGISSGWSAVDVVSKTIVLLFDVSAMQTLLWDPFTGATVSLGQRGASPRSGPRLHASHEGSAPASVHAATSDHPMPHRTTFAATTVECQELYVLTPKQQATILRESPQAAAAVSQPSGIAGSIPAQSLSLITSSTVLAFLSVERTGLGGGEKRQYYLNFATLDGSLRTKLLLKGKSLLATLPSSAEVIVAMWTASAAPPHPLFEATECGIGAIIRFGRAMLEGEKLRSGEQEKTSRRMVWAIWASVVVMGLSFVTTVMTLLYNGWWLHMQFLFSPHGALPPQERAGVVDGLRRETEFS
jgi:hypothetical protein